MRTDEGRAVAGTGSSHAPRWPWLAGLAVVAALGTFMSLRNSLWYDEACTLATTAAGPGDALRRALRFEQQPPLYFLLAWSWRVMHPSVEFLRLLSVVISLGTITLLARISRDLRIGSRGWDLALLGALTPQLLWAASEARVYALAILSVTASTWLFLRLLDPDRPVRDRDLLAYAAVSYLGLLTFYYTGFVLLGHAIAALRSSRAREMTVALGAVGLLFLPWIPGVLDQLQARLNYLPPLDWTTLPPGLALARAAGGWSLATVVESIFRFTPFMRTPAGLALVLASVAGVLAARLRRGSRRLGGAEGQLLLAAATPVAVLLLLRVTNLSLVEERHWVVAVPGLLLLPGLVLAGAAPGWPRRAASALLLATFALGTVSYARNYRGQADWKAVGRYLNINIHAADPVLFFATDGALPLAYYVPRSNPVYTLPVPNWQRPRAQLEMRPSDEGIARQVLAEAREAGAFWIVERGAIAADSALVTLGRYTGDSLATTVQVQLGRTRVRRLAVIPRDQARR